ncbi:cobalamin biosynthesis protein [Alteromonas oceanisediminis]|uniref:cobalamin biosynthesis protein n=1 Tax=Alteromonas oceanisediminis TaxID=2836180 RepID=UPI001BDA76A7|nr:cobalamin biosynthesis protein [Alteromonas oceanisediminis]MBT0585235.1 cobalamin biosynthesis protein [Alteromonas oceanisediminis]
MQLWQQLLANHYVQAFVVMLVVVAIESLWRWPEKYHPLTFVRLLALRMAEKVNQGSKTSPRQNAIAGGLGFVVLFTPLLLILALFLSVVHYRVVFDALLLLVALSFTPVITRARQTAVRLAREQKVLAREVAGTLVLRDTKSLSPMGCAKAAMESVALRLHYQYAAVLLLFFCLGALPALALRVVLECSHVWHVRQPHMQYFGAPIARANRVVQWFPGMINTLWLGLFFRPWKTLPAFFTSLPLPNRYRFIKTTSAILDCELGGPALYAGTKFRHPRYHQQKPLKLAHLNLLLNYVTAAKLALLSGYLIAAALLFMMGFG